MKWSDVLRNFYKIGLDAQASTLSDYFYSGAVHHLRRYEEAAPRSPEAHFHMIRHRAHLRQLVTVPFERGSFDKAEDPSCRNLEERASWNPDGFIHPHYELFDDLEPDHRYGIGEPHPLDVHLHKDLRPPIPARLIDSAGRVLLLGLMGAA